MDQKNEGCLSKGPLLSIFFVSFQCVPSVKPSDIIVTSSTESEPRQWRWCALKSIPRWRPLGSRTLPELLRLGRLGALVQPGGTWRRMGMNQMDHETGRWRQPPTEKTYGACLKWRDPNSWMVYFMENPSEHVWFGGIPISGNFHIYNL